MIVKILGSGCNNCRKLEDNTRTALSELGLTAEVEHVTDFGQIDARISSQLHEIEEKILDVSPIKARGKGV